MAVLTAAASLSVLIPLSRQLRDAATNSGAARSIYADQLRELSRDKERGLIADGEAEAARIELSRRLLRADQAAEAPVPAPPRGQFAALLFALIIIPLIAVGTYLLVGSPNLADEPLAGRATEAPTDVAAIVKKVEAHLAVAPDDGRGWDVIAPIYARLGRFDDAARAFGNANRILGPTAERESQLGEALAQAKGGVVDPEASAAFQRALSLDPKNLRARFYIAIGLAQQGKRDDAVAAWTALIADAPKDAPWLPVAEQQRSALTGATQPGPSTSDVDAAAQKSPQERMQMIEGMVSGLAERLATTPDDPAGWQQLFRAYMVLGRPGDADAALKRARVALAGKPDELAKVEQAAHDTGVLKD